MVSAPQFPFSAIVGMDDLRLALTLNAISPGIGGVLIRGEKGTAKSTSVRALSAVLPEIDVVVGCRFGCDPTAADPGCPDGPHDLATPTQRRAVHLSELPVGSSEDRLVGSLDIEKALVQGIKSFEPGLLAAANRGILYVDEVNLLNDHLVDLMLDAAALGTNYVERDGVSVRHAARFLLVGTMNPEEGELRPQLLDRFGLTVEVKAPREPRLRAEVVRRRLRFDDSPATFAAEFAASDVQLAERIAAARARLSSVRLDDQTLARIAYVCAAFDVDGLRADIVTARTAIAHAAWCGRDEVIEDDLRVAALLSLPHRRRRNPFDAPGLDPEQLDQILAESHGVDPEPHPEPPAGGGARDESEDGPQDSAEGAQDAQGETESAESTQRDERSSEKAAHADSQSEQHDSADGDEAGQAPEASEAEPESIDSGPAHVGVLQVVAPAEVFRARLLAVPGVGTGAAGRRSRAVTSAGHVVGSRNPEGSVRRLHMHATMLAAAGHQHARGRTAPGLILAREDLRETRREGREANLVIFAVDSSGSMAARSRMAIVKGAVLSLLMDAYQRRDKVGLVTFGAGGAELLLPPTSSVEAAATRLTQMPTGGRTPLRAGLLLAHQTVQRERLRDPRRRALLVVVTDGRHTEGGDPGPAADLLVASRTAGIVVDCESGRIKLGMAQDLAVKLGAVHLNLADLAASPDGLADTVRNVRNTPGRSVA